MSTEIIRSIDSIGLVGAGEVSPDDLNVLTEYGNRVVAADGGAAICLEMGLMPDAVIGDMDSLPDAVRAALPAERLHEVAEQDTTDFDKCLASVSAPLIVAIGFLGRRLDHTLAAFNTLVRHAEQPTILVGSEDIAFHLSQPLDLNSAPGTRLSLFPLAPVRGRSEGLRWPIDGIDFAPGGRIGTSNETSGPVHIRMDGPGMIAIMPRGALDLVARALSGSNGARAGR